MTHCIAGGCSSVATSFVFTPSERIKQQMQIGTQYKNCWYVQLLYASYFFINEMRLKVALVIYFFTTDDQLQIFIIRNALVGCIEKGGVATLYAGWRAVLCRNIPHSIIKVHIVNHVPVPSMLHSVDYEILFLT